jgi:uncharacterized membrane protein
MDTAELDARYQREVAALIEARGIKMNKSFILLFFICVLVALIGLLVVAVSGLAGWVLVAVLGVIGGIGAWSGKGEMLMLLGAALLALVSGVFSVIVTIYVFAGAH